MLLMVFELQKMHLTITVQKFWMHKEINFEIVFGCQEIII